MIAIRILVNHTIRTNFIGWSKYIMCSRHFSVTYTTISSSPCLCLAFSSFREGKRSAMT